MVNLANKKPCAPHYWRKSANFVPDMKGLFQISIRGVFFLLGLVAATAAAAQQPARPGQAARPAQPEPAQDTLKRKEVLVDHADLFEYIQRRDSVLQKLNGNVALRQDSIYMYCDTATIRNRTYVEAIGRVIIQQGDSLNVYADMATYDGIARLAELFGEVVLVNGEQQLFTDRLTYDLNLKLATYSTGATMVLGETQLTSKKGYYYVDEQQIYFRDSVVVIDPNFNLRADTLGFNTETRVVTFLGPTLITADSARIYTEQGYYDTENNLAAFTRNAQYVKGEQQATADTIRYDGQRKRYQLEGNAQFEEGQRIATADIIIYDEANDKSTLIGNARFRDEKQDIQADEIVYDAKNEVYSTRGRSIISDPPQILEADQVDFRQELGLGIATGNVIWQDTSAELTIICELAEYDRKSDFLKATGGRSDRPLLIAVLDGDSLFMASDTLFAMRADTLEGDSSRLLRAYHDVRIFKSDLQAICDSLAYSTVDSTFRLFQTPLVWADTTQFSADTVNMLLKDQKLDRIYLLNNSFIVNSPDELFFNQIKGKNITAFFAEDQLSRMAVIGNAESVYYARDELGGYVGVNKTVCSEMMLYFNDNQIEKIKFYNEPKAEMKPMRQANHQELQMTGFFWERDARPMGLDDLFKPKVESPHQEARAAAAAQAATRSGSGGQVSGDAPVAPRAARDADGNREE
jgi:lipopolysaccharide export system protein LptA